VEALSGFRDFRSRRDGALSPSLKESESGRAALFVETFFGESHKSFAEGWPARSRHDWELISLPGDRWKWRMRTAGLALGGRLARLSSHPEVVVVSGLVDLAHLRHFSGERGALPHLVYFHENQFSYPRPVGQALERGFAVAHLATLMAADAVAWNSVSHREAMLAGLRSFLEDLPEPVPEGVEERTRAHGSILMPGIDFDGFPAPRARPVGVPPVIVWNHRWEEDKRPSCFARLLSRIDAAGRDFRLILLGTTQQVRPKPLEEIEARFAAKILHVGTARTRGEYIEHLRRADIAVSTADQENFGYAVLESMAAGAVTLMPRRLSYPEIVPESLHGVLLYDSQRDLLARILQFLDDPRKIDELRPIVMQRAREHDWAHRVDALDAWVDEGAVVHARKG